MLNPTLHQENLYESTTYKEHLCHRHVHLLGHLSGVIRVNRLSTWPLSKIRGKIEDLSLSMRLLPEIINRLKFSKVRSL